MPQIEIRPATQQDALYIGERLRASDAVEVALLAPGEHPARAVDLTRAASIFSRAVDVNGSPAVVFGVSPSWERLGWGKPWMVATDAIRSISRRFLIGSVDQVADMHREFAALHNIVHARNHLSINWLRWLGFTVEAEPCGPAGEFLQFWRKNNVR